ncbi:MAG: hypothetical protein M1480_10505 [Bacteroidetes bacterium]|nr:hypothetical protein [Bacteroidota bacterium]
MLIFSKTSFAQVDYSFSGYIVDLPVYSINNSELSNLAGIDKNQFLNLMRIRLRPEIYLWSGGRFNIEYEIDALYSKQNPFSFVNQTSDNRQVIKLRWQLFHQNNFNVTHYFDRLYFRQGFDQGNIIIGRQRIAWGVGRVWSPTDLFNPINPANFGKIEKDGVDAAAITYSFGNFTDLNIVYNPQNKFSESNTGFRLRTNFDKYDFALVGGYFDKRIITGGDFAGNFFDAGIRGEGIISMDKENLNNNFLKLIFGMDNQFTSKLYGLFEYQYNGEGALNKFDYDLLGLYEGRIINLSRNYIVVSASYQLTALLTTTVSNNSNLNDGSGYLNLSGVYSLTDNSSLTAGGLISYGNRFSEYWYYPTSFYLQAEMFF